MRRKLGVIGIFALSLVISGCGNSVFESNKSGYTQVNSVDGVVFDMPEYFLSAAQAITTVSSEEDYGTNSYLYKNGETTYLLFDMDEVIVAVENTTNYNIAESDNKKDAILEKDLDGIWFSIKDKLNYDEGKKDGTYKFVADVIADVSVTPELYGKFSGKFVNVVYEDFECSMFVGVKGEEYSEFTSEQKKVINHVSKSLMIDKESIPTDMTNSTVSTTEELESDITIEENTEEVIQDLQVIEKNETEVIEIEVPEENTESEIIENEITSIEHESAVVSGEGMISGDNMENVIETEVIEEDYADNSEIDEKDYIELESNQTASGNMYSDIYHLLTVGQKGILMALNSSGTGLDTSYITPTQLYVGTEAIDIVKAYCRSGASSYVYEDAPDGYSWHVLEYTLETDPEELYVDIKLKGLDGEKLKFRGVTVSSRTRDIFSYCTKTESGFEKLYCYYAVPNGCMEYMIECGTRVNDTSDTACYHIKDYQ